MGSGKTFGSQETGVSLFKMTCNKCGGSDGGLGACSNSLRSGKVCVNSHSFSISLSFGVSCEGAWTPVELKEMRINVLKIVWLTSFWVAQHRHSKPPNLCPTRKILRNLLHQFGLRCLRFRSRRPILLHCCPKAIFHQPNIYTHICLKMKFFTQIFQRQFTWI